MTASKVPENLVDSSNICQFDALQGNQRQAEELSDEDEIDDSPEWTDSETHFSHRRVPPRSRALKDSHKDVTNDDVDYWEKEISDLKKSLQHFQLALAEGRNSVVEDLFKFQPSEEYRKENDAKAFLAEIEKMDAVLKMKSMEEKKAKLSRLQVEEESRKILANLQNVTMAKRIKMNSEEFLKLLCEDDKPYAGFAKEEAAGEEECDRDDVKGDKRSDGSEDKNFKPTENQSKLKFVERNIQLAKCGRGVLSLTDEEKQRIEMLLIDIADPKQDDEKKQKIENSTEPDSYALDDESKSILSGIDQRLEALSKEKATEPSQSNLNLLENVRVEEDSIKKTGKEKAMKKKRLPNRLFAVNKLLNDISSVTDEEISPLPPEDINRLIEEANKCVREVESRPSPEVIAELVSNAKALMPKFKYRFEED